MDLRPDHQIGGAGVSKGWMSSGCIETVRRGIGKSRKVDGREIGNTGVVGAVPDCQRGGRQGPVVDA
jgi:hypothetical protein